MWILYWLKFEITIKFRVQTEFLSNTNDLVVQNSDALNKQKAI